MKINIHIERIVIDGLAVDRHTAPQIKQAVQAELSRLIQQGQLESLSSSAAIANLRTESISLQPTAGAHSVGTSVARAIHGGLIS